MARGVAVSPRQLAEYCECIALSKGFCAKSLTVKSALKIASIDNNIISLEQWANGKS